MEKRDDEGEDDDEFLIVLFNGALSLWDHEGKRHINDCGALVEKHFFFLFYELSQPTCGF